MPFRQGSAKVFCIAVQLMALLLLQGYFLAPALLKITKHAAAGKSCYGSHRLCGCPPGRIADQTCCCFRATHSCCHDTEETVAFAGSDEDNGDASLRSAPCGLFTDSDLLSPDSSEFLVAEPLPAIITNVASSRFLPYNGRLEVRLAEPPDPPPRIVGNI